MKNIQATLYLLLASSFFMAAAQAHDPSEHTAKMEKPKCEAMKNMDHSKMDVNDPVMMAMMKKCMSNASSDGHHTEDTVKSPAGESHKNDVEKQAGGHDH
jgi:hypothetical protein